MSLRRFYLLGLFLTLGLCATGRPSRADEALDAFPTQAGFVLRLSPWDKMSGGFREFVTALGPAAAVAAPGFDASLGQLLEVGGVADAVDRTAPAYVAAFPLMAEPKPFAVLVKAADETKLRRAVLKTGADDALSAEKRDDGFEKVTHQGQTWFFGRHGDWIIYTSCEAVLGQLVFDRAAGTFSQIGDARAAEMLNGGDGGILVNVARLTEVFGDQNGKARETTLRTIESLPDEQLNASGADPQTVKKLYASLASLGFDALGDAQWAAGRVTFGAAGVKAAGLLGVKQGSGTDAVLAANPTSALENLGLLPKGATGYAGVSLNYQQFAEWGSAYTSATQDPAKAEKLQAATAALLQAGGGPLVAGVSLAGPGLVTSILQQVADPAAVLVAYRDYNLAVGETKTPIFTTTMEYQSAAETYKDNPVDILTQKFAITKLDDVGLQIAQKIIEKFFGGSALQTRLTPREGLLIQVTGNDQKFFREAVDGLESGENVLGLDEAFAKTRDQLAEEANLVALLNVPQLIVEFVRLIRDVPPINTVLAQVPFNFGAQPGSSYGGISVGAEAQALRLQVYVPVEQPQGVLRIFGQGP